MENGGGSMPDTIQTPDLTSALRPDQIEKARHQLTGCPINLVKFKKEHPKTIPR